jgi:hypothetical protein
MAYLVFLVGSAGGMGKKWVMMVREGFIFVEG